MMKMDIFHVLVLIVLTHILHTVYLLSHDNSDGQYDESDELSKRHITSCDFVYAISGINIFSSCRDFWFAMSHDAFMFIDNSEEQSSRQTSAEFFTIIVLSPDVEFCD